MTLRTRHGRRDAAPPIACIILTMLATNCSYTAPASAVAPLRFHHMNIHRRYTITADMLPYLGAAVTRPGKSTWPTPPCPFGATSLATTRAAEQQTPLTFFCVLAVPHAATPPYHWQAHPYAVDQQRAGWKGRAKAGGIVAGVQAGGTAVGCNEGRRKRQTCAAFVTGRSWTGSDRHAWRA